MIHESVRFFPYWNIQDSSHVVGFLNMLNYIVSIRPNINHYVEIGSNIGESTTLVLGFPQIKNVYCIDIWINSNIKSFFDSKITSSKNNNVQSFHMPSKDAANIINFELDVVYIDGDHSYHSVKEDIELWYSKIVKNGFLCGHDYNAISWPECKRAIDEFAVSNNFTIKTFCDSSWVIQKV